MSFDFPKWSCLRIGEQAIPPCVAGRLNTDLRSDIVFGATYFALRVCLHTVLAWVVFTWPHEHPKLLIVQINVWPLTQSPWFRAQGSGFRVEGLVYHQRDNPCSRPRPPNLE